MKEAGSESNNTKNTAPQFINKIYEILEKNEFENIISWSSNNTQIHIKNPKALQEQVLPAYFRHKKIESFIRQLNMYRFSKVNKVNKEKNHMFFKNDQFRKGNIQALANIKRKKKGPDSVDVSHSEQEGETLESYQQFLKQNVRQLQNELVRIRKNHPELELQMAKLMEISTQMIGQQSCPSVPVVSQIITNYPFDAFKTIPEFKITSIQHFDSKCSIDNEINKPDHQ